MIPIKLIQNRVADISIGPSTLRGQPTGSIRKTKNFLKKLNLDNFASVNNEANFLNNLNLQTNSLKNILPSGSWGFARKALNIFLFQAAQDIHLSEKYKLINLIPYLELPLDNPNGKKLVSQAEQRGKKLHWKNIKSLMKEDSDELQNFAKGLARKKYKCKRCYLDVLWRAKKDVE